MPVVVMPDGTRVRFPDDMPRDQIRSMILQKFPDAEQTAKTPRAPAAETERKTDAGVTTGPVRPPKSGLEQVVQGFTQGALDPVEGAGQMFEHATGRRIPIPQSVRDRFFDFQKEVESTGLGRGSEVAGSVAAQLLATAAGGALLRGGRALFRPRVPAGPTGAVGAQRGVAGIRAWERALGRPLTSSETALARNGAAPPTPPAPPRVQSPQEQAVRRGATGAIGGAAQPVKTAKDDEDFWRQKAIQTGAGAVLGGVAGGGAPLRSAVHHYPLVSLGGLLYGLPHLAHLIGSNPVEMAAGAGTLGALAASRLAGRVFGPAVPAGLGAIAGQAEQYMERPREDRNAEQPAQ